MLPDEKKPFENMARALNEDHKTVYPGWKYKPEIRREKQKRIRMHEEGCEKKSARVVTRTKKGRRDRWCDETEEEEEESERSSDDMEVDEDEDEDPPYHHRVPSRTPGVARLRGGKGSRSAPSRDAPPRSYSPESSNPPLPIHQSQYTPTFSASISTSPPPLSALFSSLTGLRNPLGSSDSKRAVLEVMAMHIVEYESLYFQPQSSNGSLESQRYEDHRRKKESTLVLRAFVRGALAEAAHNRIRVEEIILKVFGEWGWKTLGKLFEPRHASMIMREEWECEDYEMDASVSVPKDIVGREGVEWRKYLKEEIVY
jgi:hypothetical protein